MKAHLGARREEILRDALRLFARHGYRATTMDDISGALGMTKGNLYHYFADKEAILHACHARCLDAVESIVLEVHASDAPPEQQLSALVLGQLRALHGEFGSLALALDIDALNPEHRREVIRRRDAFERAMRAVIARGIAEGVFDAADPKLATFALLGAVNWSARWWRPGGDASAEDLSRTFTDLFLRGLLPRPPLILSPQEIPS